MLTVEKIGGTSMSQFEDVLQNIILKDKNNIFNRIFVVSAYSGVTNWLLENKKTQAPGIYGNFIKQSDYNAGLDELLQNLKNINQNFQPLKLDIEAADKYIEKRIIQTKAVLNSMYEVICSGYVNKKDILLAVREVLASVGEAHSAFNSVNILKNNDINATLIDLSGFHDSHFWTIDERIKSITKDIDFSKTVCIATGYTKGVEGIMREFDRGYSEVTFSKIAVEVNADEAIIHKEYHLSSADPNIVGLDNAIPVGQTNYDVADQLADIGMEAIHPKASKPLELNNIPLRIKNTFEPDHPGTLISNAHIGEQARVEIITGSNKVTIIEIHDSSMVGEVGFDFQLMQILYERKVSYILKATNANSISIVVWDKDAHPKLIEYLKANYQRVTVKQMAVICVIGSNIALPGVLAKATSVLAENKINVNCFSQSLRQVNMQFVIDREKFNEAILHLNQALCVEQ